MNITMTITTDTPVELFSTIKGCNAMIVSECPVATPDKPVNPTPAPAAMTAPTMPRAPVQSMPVTPAAAPIPMPPVGQTAPVAPIAGPTPAAMPMPPAAPPVAAPMPTAPLADPPKFTIDAITKAGGDFAQAGHMQELVNLLQQYGVQAVTQLQPEQIGPFATALRGLGAKI